MTGFDVFEFSVGGKRLELLKEAAPAVTRVGRGRAIGCMSGMRTKQT
jgi:hypothetical protein